jgi:polysaccharide deacetylase 2 family uncharacterized protein YibQ
MFSKKNQTLAYAAGPAKSDAPAGLGPIMAGAFKNPVLSVGGAAGFFLAAAAAVVLVAGDPRAGTPHVRFPLSPPGAPPPPPGWREALSPDRPGDAPVSLSDLRLTPNTADGGPIQGQAVISFPGDPTSGLTDHASQALTPAPIAGLTAPGPGGAVLPAIAPDGRTPAQAYARPFQPNGKPKIALVIGGLGLNAKATRQAIEQLPPEVTLSFVPYSEGLQGWIDLARANGHEVLLETPMEPKDYPDNDPGPFTLMAGASPQETQGRMEWLMSRATGYFGLTNYLGSKFVATNTAMATFMQGVRQHGLAFIDDGSAVRDGGGAPRASADRVIDDQLAGDAIDQQLLGLEASALQNGQALGSGFAYPITLDQVTHWAAALPQRGYQLAPASALTLRR